MNEITISQLRLKGNKEQLKEWMPARITADGEIIGYLVGEEELEQPDQYISSVPPEKTEQWVNYLKNGAPRGEERFMPVFEAEYDGLDVEDED